MRRMAFFLVELILLLMQGCAAFSEEEKIASACFAAMEADGKLMQMRISETVVTVEWEDNDAVSALKELVRNAPLSIEMSMYGGFEQVGDLGESLARNDVLTHTQAGIMKISYKQAGDYLIPDLTLPCQPEKPLGKYGRRQDENDLSEGASQGTVHGYTAEWDAGESSA